MGDVIWQARHSPLSKELHGWLNHPLNCKLNLKLFTLVLFRDKISKIFGHKWKEPIAGYLLWEV